MDEQKTAGVDAGVESEWRAAGLSPLWESAVSHKAVVDQAKVLHWRWRDLEPLISKAMTHVSPENVERRVLLFSDPYLSAPGRAMSSRTMNAGLQILMSGEVARPHRHTIDAIRFVLQGRGAQTIVNGQSCEMAPGDLVLTPGGCWHEHSHTGDEPIIWFDGLNGPLHRFLGTALFEPGPVSEQFAPACSSPYVEPALRPDVIDGGAEGCTIFRYPWQQVAAALDAAPQLLQGFRRVRYVDPATGHNPIPLMDLSAMQFDPRLRSTPHRTNANTICVVVEGAGETSCGENVFSWSAKDVFILPPNVWTTHRAEGAHARLFMLSDREIYRRLGVLQEAYGNQPGPLPQSNAI